MTEKSEMLALAERMTAQASYGCMSSDTQGLLLCGANALRTAAASAEPVAWRWRDGLSMDPNPPWRLLDHEPPNDGSFIVEPLYTHSTPVPASEEPVAPPKNLPDRWEYQERTNSVICGGCLFRFGAEHPDSDGKWTCPNCGDGGHE